MQIFEDMWRGMTIWQAVLKVVLFPGRLAVRLAPEMEYEAERLLFHMVNYIFWLTPTLGVLIWVVIRHSIAVSYG